MKKNNLFFVVMIFTMLLLAACNTSDEGSTTDPASDPVTEEVNGTGQLTETDEKQNNSTDNNTVNEEKPTVTPNGKETNGDTTKASGDNYTVEVQSGFTFSPEEPGKDVIMYDENGGIYVRIESFTKNDTTFKDLVTNTEEWMTAVSEQYSTNNIDPLLENQNMTNATSFVADFEDEKVVTVVFEKGNLLVRLTIFDQNDVNLTETLIKMGFTIEEK